MLKLYSPCFSFFAIPQAKASRRIRVLIAGMQKGKIIFSVCNFQARHLREGPEKSPKHDSNRRRSSWLPLNFQILVEKLLAGTLDGEKVIEEEETNGGQRPLKNKKKAGLTEGNPRRGPGGESACEKGHRSWLSTDSCLCSSNTKPYVVSFCWASI